MLSDITVESLSHDLFQYFPSALKEADGAVCFGLAVVRLVRFVDGDYSSGLPRVCPCINRKVEQFS